MSVTSFAGALPARIALADVALMAAADEHHRYELSPEGTLSIMPPADPDHVMIVSRLSHWFWQHGYGWEQVAADCGVAVGTRTSGGRVPDLTVWAVGHRPNAVHGPYAAVTGLLVAIEVISAGSEATDRLTKKQEYAAAGIPRYWLVERDAANTVTMYELDASSKQYVAAAAPAPLSWLVNSAPSL